MVLVALVEVERGARRRRAPDADRHRVDHLLKLPLTAPQGLLGVHLIVDIVADAVPMDDAPGLVAHRLRPARHPVIDAVRATQAIPDREAFTGDETSSERGPERGGVVRMDGGLDHRRQAAHAGFVGVRHIQAEKIHHALVEEGWLALGRQSPDVARNHVDQLRELALAVAQGGLDLFLLLDVDRDAQPFGDAPLAVAGRSHRGSKPAVRAIGQPQAVLVVARLAGSETILPPGGGEVVVVRVNVVSPPQFALFRRVHEVVARAVDEGLGNAADVLVPALGVGRPHVAGDSLADRRGMNSASFALEGRTGSYGHWLLLPPRTTP